MLCLPILLRKGESQSPARGVLAHIRSQEQMIIVLFKLIIDFGSQSAYYVSLGTNLDQTILYLGVYGSMKVTDFNQGTVFGIIP